MNWRLTYTRHFVRELGFTLGLDFDGALIIERPEAVSVEAIVELLVKCQASLQSEIKADADRQRRQYVGGPYNGQRHGVDGWNRALTVPIARARWAAYWVGERDPRAFYVGETTSMTKARQLAKQNGPRLFAAAAQE